MRFSASAEGIVYVFYRMLIDGTLLNSEKIVGFRSQSLSEFPFTSLKGFQFRSVDGVRFLFGQVVHNGESHKR
jgi:hypothetical protein